MAKHTWSTGETITADLMNALETTADEAKSGAMTGTAAQLTKIATPESTEAAEVATLLNTVIDQLIARGVAKA